MTVKAFVAGIISLTMSSAVMAADLPANTAPQMFAPPIPTFSWTGLYLGAQVGYAFGRDMLSAPPFFAFGYARDGVVGGGHAGYNYQINRIVVGIEGDVDGSGADGSTINPFNRASVGSRIPVDGSIRGRVGLAIDRVLFFATGGAAFASIQNSYTGLIAPGVLHTNVLSQSRVGWTVGGGVEYALTDNWSIRADYRYSDYGSFASFPGTSVVARINRNTDQRVEGGVSYKFTTLLAPVVARY